MYGVVTQGRSSPILNQWVTTYNVEYSIDCVNYVTVRDNISIDMVICQCVFFRLVMYMRVHMFLFIYFPEYLYIDT